MLSLNYVSLAPALEVLTIDDFTHLATSSLNSLEYMTAVTMGIAQESCVNAAKNSDSILNAKSPIEITACFSMAPMNLLAELNHSCLQIHEAAKKLF